MRHAGQVVTRTMLLEGVWNFSFDPNEHRGRRTATWKRLGFAARLTGVARN